MKAQSQIESSEAETREVLFSLRHQKAAQSQIESSEVETYTHTPLFHKHHGRRARSKARKLRRERSATARGEHCRHEADIGALEIIIAGLRSVNTREAEVNAAVWQAGYRLGVPPEIVAALLDRRP